MRKVMGHTALSATQTSLVTLKILQHGAKDENYSKFETFQIVVNTKTSIIQKGPNISNVG